MVSVTVSILGTIELIIEPGVKINGAYYRDVLLGHLLPAIRSVAARLLHLQCSSSPSW